MRTLERGGALIQAHGGGPEARAKVHGRRAGRATSRSGARSSGAGRAGPGQLRDEIVGMLALAAQRVFQAARGAMQIEIAQPVAGLQQAVTQELGDLFAQIAKVRVELLARADDHLRGGGRRGSADIGGEIRDGEVGLMADAGDDGNRAGDNGASDGLFVKSPQVFQRAAAARQDQNVGKLLAVEIADGLHDFAGSAIALHADGIKHNVQVGEAPLQDAHNVADGGAAAAR